MYLALFMSSFIVDTLYWLEFATARPVIEFHEITSLANACGEKRFPKFFYSKFK